MQTIFLKLGGSSIEPGEKGWKVRLRGFAKEISEARNTIELSLVLGTGAGTRIHELTDKYGLHKGITGPRSYLGTAHVHREAARANQVLVDQLIELGVAAIQVSPLCLFQAEENRIVACNTKPLETLLMHKMIPVLYGDVVFDSKKGCTILSTENILTFLAINLKASRIIIVGKEEGVFENFRKETQKLVPEITRRNYREVLRHLRGSEKERVTGGMDSKVKALLEVAKEGIESEIIADQPGFVERALLGEKRLGTRIVPW